MGKITKQQRIWDKTGGHCWYCGKVLRPWNKMQSENSNSQHNVFCIDHIIPKSRGGTNKLENLLPSCWSCNSGEKRDKTLEEYREFIGYKKINAPLFTDEQKQWLLKNGIKIPHPPKITFWGESNL